MIYLVPSTVTNEKKRKNSLISYVIKVIKKKDDQNKYLLFSVGCSKYNSEKIRQLRRLNPKQIGKEAKKKGKKD